MNDDGESTLRFAEAESQTQVRVATHVSVCSLASLIVTVSSPSLPISHAATLFRQPWTSQCHRYFAARQGALFLEHPIAWMYKSTVVFFQTLVNEKLSTGNVPQPCRHIHSTCGLSNKMGLFCQRWRDEVRTCGQITKKLYIPHESCKTTQKFTFLNIVFCLVTIGNF